MERIIAMLMVFALTAASTGPDVEAPPPKIDRTPNLEHPLGKWLPNPPLGPPQVPIPLTSEPAQWVLPEDAAEVKRTHVVLMTNYRYWERSERVVSLQELVGVEADGHYGPATREAHTGALEAMGLDTEVVPAARSSRGLAYPVPDRDYGHGVERWRPQMTQAVFAWGGTTDDVHRFMRIMKCESGGDPDAFNRSSAASGLLQHLQRFWPERAAAVGMPDASPFDPWANMYVSAWLALAAPGGGWGHWVCK